MEQVLQKTQELLAVYGLKVLAAVAIFVIGRWIAKLVLKLVRRVLAKRNLDPMVVSFGGNVAYVTLLVFVVLAALGQLGIQTTSFIAVIGAAGLAIGLAFQSSLANFAAGFLMVMFRPFKVGDFIEGAGKMGIVEEIQMFTTKLRTPDNKLVIVPNAKITGDAITNFTAKDTRRIELKFGVGYADELPKVRKLIQGVINADERILNDPAPQIVVGELADSSVNFIVRVWVKTSEYWNVYFDTIEKVKMRFDEQGVSIPFPQRDVHLFPAKTAAMAA